MKHLLSILFLILGVTSMQSQTVPTPGEEQSIPIALTNATIHVGNGTVIEGGTILFENGKISGVGADISIPTKAQVIDHSGKHIYPGMIAIDTRIGLKEVDALRQTRDYDEVGPLNANVRALIAYNTDSWVTPTIRSNGVLLAQVAPTGGRISGTSSVVQLDAWNWEDAAYKADDAIFINWPREFRWTGWWAEPGGVEKVDSYNSQLTEMRNYFAEAQSYANQGSGEANLRFESMKGLFDGSKQLFIRVNTAASIISAVRFAQDYGISPVILGGRESYQVAEFLVENNVPVVIDGLHRTPDYEDEALFHPYELPALLEEKGVQFAITHSVDFWQTRNLPFQAGQAVAYGLDYERAVSAVTLDAAKVLGIDDHTGSLEIGKDANIVVSSGDMLDMMSNDIVAAYVEGRALDLGNKQKDLYKKFSEKFGHQAVRP